MTFVPDPDQIAPFDSLRDQCRLWMIWSFVDLLKNVNFLVGDLCKFYFSHKIVTAILEVISR